MNRFIRWVSDTTENLLPNWIVTRVSFEVSDAIVARLQVTIEWKAVVSCENPCTLTSSMLSKSSTNLLLKLHAIYHNKSYRSITRMLMPSRVRKNVCHKFSSGLHSLWDSRAPVCVALRAQIPCQSNYQTPQKPPWRRRLIGEDFNAIGVPSDPLRLWRNNFYSGKLRTEFPVWWTQFMGTFCVYSSSVFDPWIRSWENFLSRLQFTSVKRIESNRSP